MPAKLDVYKCEKCGSIVEFLEAGSCTPQCCGSAMTHMVEGATDGAVEKHVPVITKVDGGYKVTVGSVAHPIVEKHYMQWIELIAVDETLTHFLNPEDAPEAVFKTDAAKVTARAYCNLHGHWNAEN